MANISKTTRAAEFGLEVVKNKQALSPEEVRALREKFGLTQKQMDERLGVGFDSTRDWERGKRAVPGPAALALRLVQAVQDGGGTIKAAVFQALWG